MIKVTVGGQDVALDLSRTLAQSGIRPGSTLKLKLTGLLGGTQGSCAGSCAGGIARMFGLSQARASEVRAPQSAQVEATLELSSPRGPQASTASPGGRQNSWPGGRPQQTQQEKQRQNWEQENRERMESERKEEQEQQDRARRQREAEEREREYRERKAKESPQTPQQQPRHEKQQVPNTTASENLPAAQSVQVSTAVAPSAAENLPAPAESAAPENEVAQRHAKLCMDASGLIRKGKFRGIAVFDSTLEEQVGYMDALALRGMYAEHVMDAASSAAPFSPPNNPSLTCTPEGEFWYVVGKDGIDITKWEIKPGALPAEYDGCMVVGRNATPLSELLKADEAERAKLRDTELIALRLYSGKKSFAGRRYGCPVVSIMLLLLHLP